MLLRCRDLWDHCYVTCCYAADGVEMQCGQRCEIERTWHVGKDLQVKNTKTSVFLMHGDKKWMLRPRKRLQSHANTNRNASHVRMRMSQNPGRVAKLQTEMLEKRSNCAGSLRAAWPCFARANANVARFKSNFLLIKLFIFWDMPCQWCADSPSFC